MDPLEYIIKNPTFEGKGINHIINTPPQINKN